MGLWTCKGVGVQIEGWVCKWGCRSGDECANGEGGCVNGVAFNWGGWCANGAVNTHGVGCANGGLGVQMGRVGV